MWKKNVVISCRMYLNSAKLPQSHGFVLLQKENCYHVMTKTGPEKAGR